MSQAAVTKVDGVGLTVGDLGAARRFYEQALGFQCIRADRLDAAELAARFGGAARSAECAGLTLGQQRIELVGFEPPGEAYLWEIEANDPWFQHFAIAVSDMDLAFRRLSRPGVTAISQGGPQRLPPSTGSVVAYKFRDPDGHPLELSYIPGSAWLDGRGRASGPCLGVDHTAIAVADLDASVDFYVGLLGMRVAANLVNTGPEQDRLDGLSGVTLDIVVLEPAEPGGPHMELLAYRSPESAERTPPPKVTDIAATRTMLAVNAVEPMQRRLQAANRPLLNPARRPSDPLLTRDPDGHLIELRSAVSADQEQ